jgi:subtilisin family serine protease
MNAKSAPSRRILVLEDFGKPGYIEEFEKRSRLSVIVGGVDWLAAHPDGSLDDGEAVVFSNLGVALVNSTATTLAKDVGVSINESEKRVARLEAPAIREPAQPASVCWKDAADSWGVQATGADKWNAGSSLVKVCVIDGGIDLNHSDFAEHKPAPTISFATPNGVQANHGHCTHCVGIIGGSRAPPPPAPTGEPWRYSVAPGVSVSIARIFAIDEPWVPEARVYAALDWALALKADIVSMSFGFPWRDSGYSQAFEIAAQRALAAECVIFAGTGNTSNRPNRVASTLHPARCPTVVAVGAVDLCEAPWKKSNGFVPGKGGKVDVVGPGQSIWSAWTHNGHHMNNGTSMACAFVAGIAALHKTAKPSLSGAKLRAAVLSRVRKLPQHPQSAVGAGLALAPKV